MPVMKINEDRPTPVKATPAKVVPPEVKTVLTDNRYDPAGSLLTFITGSNWTVNYYSQLLGADDELQGQQIARPPAYQQYKLIKSMEFKVTSPLSQTQDPQSKEMQVSGTAYAPGAFIPNAGDMFLADIGDGRAGIFQVTNTERSSYLKASIYTLEYKLLTFADNAAFIQDLEKKTVQEATYVADFLQYGQNPVILDGDYANYQNLRKLYYDLIGIYFRDFFSIRFQTLIVPEQKLPTYDHFLTTAVDRVVGEEDHPYVKRIRELGVGGDQAMLGRTMWDGLLELNETTLSTTVERVGLLGSHHFKILHGGYRNLPWLTGVYYAGIGSVVYPLDCRTDVDAYYDPDAGNGKATDAYKVAGARYCTLERVLRDHDLDGFHYDPSPCDTTDQEADAAYAKLPAIVPVTQDDYYVFTQGFYGANDQKPASQLEVLTLNTIKGESINHGRLLRLGEMAFKWDNLERFYYIPVLFALIQTALRRN